MENFNKNWLIILLIATVFLILGFLLGRVTAPQGGFPGHGMEKRIIRLDPHQKDMLIEDGGENITIKIDTLVNNGKELEVKVEKKVKK
jgi:hypothetical protein